MAKIHEGRASVMGSLVHGGLSRKYECCKVCGKPVRRWSGLSDGKVLRHKKAGAWCSGGATPRAVAIAGAKGGGIGVKRSPRALERHVEWRNSKSLTLSKSPSDMRAVARKLRRETEAALWLERVKARKAAK